MLSMLVGRERVSILRLPVQRTEGIMKPFGAPLEANGSSKEGWGSGLV